MVNQLLAQQQQTMVMANFDYFRLQMCIFDGIIFDNFVFEFWAAQLLLINLNQNMTHEDITLKHHVDNLHKFKTNVPAICTGVSIHGTNIATVGEDGR